ncbi:MAG TPA: COX15/CtaA family protein [Steroidobacteraceae bacterium]|jgi:cytochrome c oxidase assembly protein subunit 15|nr:COX15/CtaA family protein [Steroidobacteraceae bacterium]
MHPLHEPHRVVWFRRLALAGAALAFCVVVLGAWVRLTDAGLGCPDWPGCYGHVFPESGTHHFARAVHEMIHRYFASTLGIIITSLLVLALIRRKDPDQPLAPVAVLFAVVCLQGLLGMKTVTLKLQPLIVTAHLLGGLTTLGLLRWLSISPERRALARSERGLRAFAVIGFAVLALQIFLGGWTSTNYAAVACPDLPTCQHSWWPSMDFGNAFVLWRGLGIDYEGGVLANPARVAIHFTHRLGAVMTGLTLLGLGAAVVLRGRNGRLKMLGYLLIAAVLLQISLGVSTVHWGVPLLLATLHNAGAALLVIVMVTILRALWPRMVTL